MQAPNGMTILIVEDEAAIAGAVSEHLEMWGYRCACIRDFRAVLEEFAAAQPQLVILDIGLPHRNGFYWCGKLREVSQVPVLFLSCAADNMSLVTAINMGGDDFLAKPFDLTVLTAKVQALLRRAYDFTQPDEVLSCRGVLLRDADGTACKDGKSVQLTRNEQRIAQTLFANKGKVVSREALMQKLWETDCYVDTNTLSVNVARLRKKLAELGAGDLIVTKKGEGYLAL